MLAASGQTLKNTDVRNNLFTSRNSYHSLPSWYAIQSSENLTSKIWYMVPWLPSVITCQSALLTSHRIQLHSHRPAISYNLPIIHLFLTCASLNRSCTRCLGYKVEQGLDPPWKSAAWWGRQTRNPIIMTQCSEYKNSSKYKELSDTPNPDWEGEGIRGFLKDRIPELDSKGEKELSILSLPQRNHFRKPVRLYLSYSRNHIVSISSDKSGLPALKMLANQPYR